MNVSNIRGAGVNPTDAVANEEPAGQYREQYRQLLSRYETDFSDWQKISASVKAHAGEAVSLAVDRQFSEAKTKSDALQTAINAFPPDTDDIKHKIGELEALLSELSVRTAAATALSDDDADIEALRKIWENLPDADKAYLGTEFTKAIETRFSELNAKIAELKKAIEDGADPSVIEALRAEIAELKTQQDTLISGKTDGSVMSVADRINCLKSLEDAKENKYVSDEEYAAFRQKLLQTDVSKQISKEDFETQLTEIVLPVIQKEVRENTEKTEAASKHQAAQNELLKNNIALRVMRENNSFLEFKINAEADEKLQEKGDFNPQVRRLRDEGSWQMPKITRQQEVTQMQNEDERRREKTAQIR